MPRGNRPSAPAEPQSQLAGQVIHISLELSQATWLVTALIPGIDKMSKHTTPGGDGVALIELVNRLRAKIDPRSPDAVAVIAIQEAGLDLTTPLIFTRHRKYQRKPFVRRAPGRTVRLTDRAAVPAWSG